jgi:hypothetical protein
LKLAAFAATVFCGPMIRVRLRPWVVGIWAWLILAAFAGRHGIAF